MKLSVFGLAEGRLAHVKVGPRTIVVWIAAIAVFVLFCRVFSIGTPIADGNGCFNDPTALDYFAKGIFCAVALVLLDGILSVLKK